MVNRELVSRKLARARRWLADAESRVTLPQNEFLSGVESRDLATFYLFLAMQATINLAAHWVADAGWEPPDNAAGAFDCWPTGRRYPAIWPRPCAPWSACATGLPTDDPVNNRWG